MKSVQSPRLQAFGRVDHVIQSIQVKAVIVFHWKSSMTPIEHNEDLSIEHIELRLRLCPSEQRKEESWPSSPEEQSKARRSQSEAKTLGGQS